MWFNATDVMWKNLSKNLCSFTYGSTKTFYGIVLGLHFLIVQWITQIVFPDCIAFQFNSDEMYTIYWIEKFHRIKSYSISGEMHFEV